MLATHCMHRGRRVEIIDYYLLHVAVRRDSRSPIYWVPLEEITRAV